MTANTVRAAGTVIRGHRVASGLCGDPRFPAGTIAPQLPIFRAEIAGFDAWLGGEAWPATVNVALTGLSVRPGEPDVAIGPVAWTDQFPPERFLMSRCVLVHRRTEYPAWLYIPDPATKPDHHQPADRVEVLTRRIESLVYGDAVTLIYAPCVLSVSAQS